jgi:hypothetical protein
MATKGIDDKCMMLSPRVTGCRDGLQVCAN